MATRTRSKSVREPNRAMGAGPMQLEQCSADELLRELRCRESGMPVDPRFEPHTDDAMARALHARQKSIYGTDDRADLYEVSDQGVRRNARGVVALVDADRLNDEGDGTLTLATAPFGRSHNLCRSERFFEQPTGPFCTGFLVAPDIIATAGHCLNRSNLATKRFVFGFEMLSPTRARSLFAQEDVYAGVGLIAHVLTDAADYALVRLERPVIGRPVLKLRRKGKLQTGDEVYVIGHPAGLPLKFAAGASVRDNDEPDYFVANLDTYGGNSGSPVFSVASGEVEGILVRGETDFVRVGRCNVSNMCPTSGCRGEDVTRASAFERFVPEAPAAEQDDMAERLAALEATSRRLEACLMRRRGS